MKEITDPEILRQFHSSDNKSTSLNGMKEITDPEILKQFNGNIKSSDSFLHTALNDILSGAKSIPNDISNFLRAGSENIANFPINIANSASELAGKPLNLKNVQYAEPGRLSTTLGHMGGDAISMVGGGGLLKSIPGVIKGLSSVNKASRSIPFIGRPLSALTGNAAQGVGGAAAYGAINSPDDRGMGALESGIGYGLPHAAFKGLEKLGNAFSKESMGNLVLKYLQKSGQKLSPKMAAKNVGENYSSYEGNPLGVDIGTATNNPLLSSIYNILKHTPLSGASKSASELDRGIINRDILRKGDEINSVKADIKSLENTNQMDFSRRENLLNEQIGKKEKEFNDVSNKIETGLEDDPSRYIDKLEGLIKGVGNKFDPNIPLSGNVRQAFKGAMKESRANYAPLNNKSIKFDNSDLSGFQRNFRKIDKERNKLLKLYDSDIELKSSLRNELDNAKSILDNSTLSLPDAMKRSQEMSRLASKLNSSGYRYQGKLLSGLSDSLLKDIKNDLTLWGSDSLANQIDIASKFHKEHVIPFYKSTEINKTLMKSHNPVGGKLGAILHDPNYKSIIERMTPRGRNVALYQYLTEGKGTSEGKTLMDASSILKKWESIPRASKKIIDSYNPEINQVFENIGTTLNTQKQVGDLLKTRKKIEKEMYTLRSTNLEKSSTSEVDALRRKENSLNDQLEDINKKLFNVNKEKRTVADVVKNVAIPSAAAYAAPLPALIAALGIIPTSRSLTKLLTNPELIQNYIKGGKFDTSSISPSRTKGSVNPEYLSTLLSSISKNFSGI